jgi:uncharacterized protein YdhG (YjbR/CyaY superfamily)
MSAPATVDAYLAALPADRRAALQRVRKIVRAAVPGVEERISYRMPGFRAHGKMLFWIGAAAEHCAIYGVTWMDRGDLAGYDTSGRGTLRFTPDEPLPAALVKKIVAKRLAAIRKPTARGRGARSGARGARAGRARGRRPRSA